MSLHRAVLCQLIFMNGKTSFIFKLFRSNRHKGLSREVVMCISYSVRIIVVISDDGVKCQSRNYIWWNRIHHKQIERFAIRLTELYRFSIGHFSKRSLYLSISFCRLFRTYWGLNEKSAIPQMSFSNTFLERDNPFYSHFTGVLTKVQIQGAVSIRKTVLPGMAIPMLKIRRPNGRLIFNMEIAIRR